MFSEDGLANLWSEMVKDGEVTGVGSSYRDHQEQEAESIKFRKSPFETFLAQWTWGEVGTDTVSVSLAIGWKGIWV